MKKLLFILGLVLLVGANIFVLSGVIYNWTGEPATVIELTERELQMPYWTNEDNSGLSLRLKWQTLDDNLWFDEEKLKNIGYNVKKYAGNDEYLEYRKVPVPKKVYIAFEYNGSKYKEAVKRAEIKVEKETNALKTGIEKNKNDLEWAEKNLKNIKDYWSRLYPVDVGLDADILNKKYNEPGKFIVVPGIAIIKYNYRNNKKEVYGRISQLAVEKINVPLKFRKTFDSLPERNKLNKYKPIPPRYKVKLAYGKRLEPWIQSTQVIE